jgi:long-chain acyl-CoA synthetase
MTASPARPWLEHYDYWVPHHINYPRVPLCEILDTAAIERPDQPATAFFGAVLSFGDIKGRSDRLAAALAHLTIAKGDRVGIMLPNCPQYVISAFAVLRLGAVVVNINPSYTARELLTIAADSGIRVLITLDALAPVALTLRGQTAIEHIVVTSLAEYSEPAGRPVEIDGALSLAAIIASIKNPGPIAVPIAPDDLAVLQYTGGTTGIPKGAMLSHANIFANVVQTDAFLYPDRSRGDHRYVIVIPYFHIYAFTLGLMLGTWVGALQVLIPKYDPDLVLSAIRDYRPTFVPAVPTLLVSMLNHPRASEAGLDKVRLFKSGGAPLPTEVMERWRRTVGRRVMQGYGLSEASPVTHSTPRMDEERQGTIGVPLPDTDIKIVDLETGTSELPPGDAGELCIAGPQVMLGYWNRREETDQVLRTDADGRRWLHTGDIARVDSSGYTYIVQRKKDLIIVDGFNVYPSEVETVLYTHQDVRLAAVVGVPDAYHGEIVKACIVLQPGSHASAGELLAHCRGQLAPYKVPRQIEIRDALPMSAVGKILYRVLRDEVSQGAVSRSTAQA